MNDEMIEDKQSINDSNIKMDQVSETIFSVLDTSTQMPVINESATTESILFSNSFINSSLYAWVKLNLKDNESLLRKLLKITFESGKEEKVIENEPVNRLTADLIINIPKNKPSSNINKLSDLFPVSETKQFSTNESSTDEIVIEHTEVPITTPVMTTNSILSSSVIISESKSTGVIIEEAKTEKIQEEANATTTQSTTIASSGILNYLKHF